LQQCPQIFGSVAYYVQSFSRVVEIIVERDFRLFEILVFDRARFDTLPAGLYIVGGQKIIKK